MDVQGGQPLHFFDFLQPDHVVEGTLSVGQQLEPF
jgi:hypothetical protein